MILLVLRPPLFLFFVFFFVVVVVVVVVFSQTKEQKLGRPGNESNDTQGQSEAEKES